jgi:hypothetical protein
MTNIDGWLDLNPLSCILNIKKKIIHFKLWSAALVSGNYANALYSLAERLNVSLQNIAHDGRIFNVKNRNSLILLALFASKNLQQAHTMCVGQNELFMSLLRGFWPKYDFEIRVRVKYMNFLTCVAIIKHEKCEVYSHYYKPTDILSPKSTS